MKTIKITIKEDGYKSSATLSEVVVNEILNKYNVSALEITYIALLNEFEKEKAKREESDDL